MTRRVHALVQDAQNAHNVAVEAVQGNMAADGQLAHAIRPPFQPWSIRCDQAIFWAQGRLARRRALARMISFRMTAVMATLAGFPAVTRA